MGNVAFAETSLTNGSQIIESVWLTDQVERVVRRTWRERLFTWPWRPWTTTKIVTVTVPSGRVLQIGNSLVMHPETSRQLRAALKGRA